MPVDHLRTDIEFIEGFELHAEALSRLENLLSASPVEVQDALAQFSPNADEFQKHVINATDKTIRVIAPAGSGKTQTAINRIFARIKEGINPKRFLVLTFDNAAVGSLRDKVKEQLTLLDIVMDEPEISTLNAYGFHILRSYFPDDYKRVIPNYRRFRIFRDIKDVLNEKDPYHFGLLPKNLLDRFYLAFFSLLKNELFDPRNLSPQLIADFIISKPESIVFFENANDTKSKKAVIQSIIWLYQTYDANVAENGFIDFDDQKLRAYINLIESPDILQLIRTSYSEIIVDEFQDINKLDFELIKSISKDATLIVTGDDDQAIYGFRGCSPEYIINLEDHLGRNTSSYELSINYRCPSNIVYHADRLIKCNKWRIPKNPIAAQKKEADIVVADSLSPSVEAKFIVTYIQKVLNADKTKGGNLTHKDIVVLYRTNSQSLPIQIEFILNGIPYYVREEDNILQNEVLEKLISCLRLKIAIEQRRSPKTEDAVNSIMAYFKYVSAEQKRLLQEYFTGNQDFVDALSSIGFNSIIPKAENSRLSVTLNELITSRTLMNSLDVLSNKFKGLKGLIGSLEDVVDDRVPLGEIFDIAAGFRGNTQGFIDMIETALRKARDMSSGTDEANGVGLRTYFRAKGLQWHTVILPTCNDGLIPHKKSPVEDERRLFYVALTRVSSNLLISYVKNVCKNKVKPSRFLIESGLL